MPSAAELIASPYDPEARYSPKRATEWVGYKGPLTEPCDEESPHLIVNVETTPATPPPTTTGWPKSMPRSRSAIDSRPSLWSIRGIRTPTYY